MRALLRHEPDVPGPIRARALEPAGKCILDRRRADLVEKLPEILAGCCKAVVGAERVHVSVSRRYDCLDRLVIDNDVATSEVGAGGPRGERRRPSADEAIVRRERAGGAPVSFDRHDVAVANLARDD
jgi:hypothetical protein